MKKKIIEIKNNLELFSQKGKWQTTIVKIVLSDLFWVLIIGGCCRLFYYSNLKDTLSETDSPSYLNPVFNIFKGEVDMWRTPVYPYFLKAIRFCTSPDFFIHAVVIVQSVISFIAVIVFYWIAKTLFRNRNVRIGSTLLFAISPSIVGFDKCILTESLSISFMVFFIAIIISHLKKPTIFKSSCLTLLIFFAIMLRPSFIILIPIFGVFWFLRLFTHKKEWKFNLSGIIASMIVTLLLIGYSNLNYKQNGFRGLTAVQNFNQLYCIIDYNMYNNGDDPEISGKIKTTLQDPSEDEWHTKTMGMIIRNYSQIRISKFIKNCIYKQPVTLIKKTLNVFYYSKDQRISVNYAQRYNYFANPFDFILNINLIPFQFIYLLLIFDFLYIALLYFKTKKINWFKILLWSIATIHTALIIVNGGGQLSRLFVILLPCIIIIVFYYIDLLLFSFNLDKKKFYHYKILAENI